MVLNHLFNLIGYNPNGREGPERAPNPRRRATSSGSRGCCTTALALFSTSDANGPFRPITVGGTCATLKQLAGEPPRWSSSSWPAITDPRTCLPMTGG